MLVACSACCARFEVGGYRDVHCPACGAMAPQGPRPPWPDDDETTPMERACIACTRPVVVQRVAGVSLESCAGCGGTFIGTDAINALLAERDERRANTVIASLNANASSGEVHPNLQRNCPTCATTMTRTLSPEGAGVIIDVCKSHGVFLDSGELRRMLEFVRREARERAELRWGRAPAIGQGSRGETSDVTAEGYVAAAALAVFRVLLGVG
jgi:Zn-finger nucleic acid-binding protein